MKRVVQILFAIALVLLFAALLIGCNKQVIDTTFKYDYAVISLPDGRIVEGQLQAWRDYDDGDQLQVKINGATYLVHSMNVALVKGTVD
jgi:hypothetical protein